MSAPGIQTGEPWAANGMCALNHWATGPAPGGVMEFLKEREGLQELYLISKPNPRSAQYFASSVQNGPYPPVWIIKKWWNKCQVMLYRDMLPRVGRVRSEILIINLYRSWKWRALLRVGKVKKELIEKKTVWKDESSMECQAGGSLRDYVILFLSTWETRVLQFVLIMAWWDPNPRFRVIEVKQCPKRCFGVIPVCTGPALMGVFPWLSGAMLTLTRGNLRNATLWDMDPLVQCWKNDANTPTEHLHIILPFLKFLYICPFSHSVLYTCSPFWLGCFFPFSNHPLVSSPAPFL